MGEIYHTRPIAVYAEQWRPPDPDSDASLEPDHLGVMYAGKDMDGTQTGALYTDKGRMIVYPGWWIINPRQRNARAMTPTDFARDFIHPNGSAV